MVLFTAAVGSVTVSGSIWPYLTGITGQKDPGSFLLTVNPSSLTITQGTSAASTITLVSVNGFKGTVTLSTDSASGYFSPTFSNRSVSLPINGTATSILTLTAANSAITGSYNVVVTGTAITTGPRRILSSSASMSVLVSSSADFNINADPSSIIVAAGSTNSTIITLTSLNRFNGTVSLSATTPFGFIGVIGGQNPIMLTANGTGSSTLQISTTGSTLPGTYNVMVTGTSGQLSHSFVIVTTVVRPDVEALALVRFSLNSPTNLTLYIQNTGNSFVTLQEYGVRDSLGDTWTMHNWAGPSVAANSEAPANILIGTSCLDCTYTGIFGLFSQFSRGQTYTVTVTTTMNNQFLFTVTL